MEVDAEPDDGNVVETGDNSRPRRTDESSFFNGDGLGEAFGAEFD